MTGAAEVRTDLGERLWDVVVVGCRARRRDGGATAQPQGV